MTDYLTMLKFLSILLISNLLLVCNAYTESPIIQINAKQFSVNDALKQAASILNVQAPGDWSNFMESPKTSGVYGQNVVGLSTVVSIMNTWKIPPQFLDQAIKSVRLIILAATEGVYTAQVFSFEVASSASLTTLLVAVTRLSSPADPNFPVSISYVTLNTNAHVKQQYSTWVERSCHRCPKCVWLSKCCCHNNPRSAPRGHTFSELRTIRQKLTHDQFVWFAQKTLPSTFSKALLDNTHTNRLSSKINSNLNSAIEQYLSDVTTKREILRSYNDSTITAVQQGFTSLKSSSKSMKFMQIEKEHLPLVLQSLSEDYDFDDIYSDGNFSQQLLLPQFSYENLFSIGDDEDENMVIIKYIWILGENIANTTYNINFFSLTINEEAFVQNLLPNANTTNTPSYGVLDKNKQLHIIRTSTLNMDGRFTADVLVKSIKPWTMNTTQTVLNILRFIGATMFVPQQFRMLSTFDTEMSLSNVMGQSSLVRSGTRSLNEKIQALVSSIKSILGGVKEIIQSISSSKTVTIERILRFGFTNFNQKTTTLKVLDIPRANANEFVQALVMDYNLPSKGSFMLGLTYSNDFSWEEVQYLYSPDMNGKYRCLTLLKNGDSVSNTASFLIIDTDTDWSLAPDLLLIRKSKSILGGLFTSASDSIQEVPHVLSIDEAIKLQQFFMLVAIGNLANSLGMNVTVPQIN